MRARARIRRARKRTRYACTHGVLWLFYQYRLLSLSLLPLSLNSRPSLIVYRSQALVAAFHSSNGPRPRRPRGRLARRNRVDGIKITVLAYETSAQTSPRAVGKAEGGLHARVRLKRLYSYDFPLPRPNTSPPSSSRRRRWAGTSWAIACRTTPQAPPLRLPWRGKSSPASTGRYVASASVCVCTCVFNAALLVSTSFHPPSTRNWMCREPAFSRLVPQLLTYSSPRALAFLLSFSPSPRAHFRVHRHTHHTRLNPTAI